MSVKGNLRGKKLIGVILIIALLGAFFLWETLLRDYFLFPEVLVLKEDTKRGSLISKDDLTLSRIGRKSSNSLGVEDSKKIIGMITTQYVKGGEPLYDEYFQDKDMVTSDGKGKFIFSLPEQWLDSYPQSLRRGDEAYIYCDGGFITQAKVAFVKDTNNKEVLSEDKDRLGGSSTVSLIEIIVDEEQAAQISQIASDGGKLVILYN